MNCLKNNTCHVLVTTDLASRGVDIYNANLVVNMSIPYPPICYLHRIGRAGRFGSQGNHYFQLHQNKGIFHHLYIYILVKSHHLYAAAPFISSPRCGAQSGIYFRFYVFLKSETNDYEENSLLKKFFTIKILIQFFINAALKMIV